MKGYSYIRFSSEIQALGTSLERQQRLAVEWCQNNNVELVETYSDLGISAFKGKNLKNALGVFLETVRSGIIPPDSYLLVESLDRISRETVLSALATFTSIINEGITLVTLVDNRIYSKESIEKNPMDLLTSILVMVRANEESEQKAHRLKNAWIIKRDKINEKILTSRIPAWLIVRDGKFQVIEERANIIRQIFDWTIQGYGQAKIVKLLNGQGIESWGDGEKGLRKGAGWQPSYIQKIWNEEKVIGTYTPGKMINGKRVLQEPIKNYYPAVIDEDTYIQAKQAIAGRRLTGGRGDAKFNIIQGIAYCACCGGKIRRVNKGYGDYQLWCDKNIRGESNNPKCKGHLKNTETLLSIVANIRELDVNSLLVKDSKHNQLQQEITIQISKLTTIDNAIQKLTEAIVMGGEMKTIVDSLKGYEKQKQEVSNLIDSKRDELHRLSMYNKELATNVEVIKELLTTDDEDIKMVVRKSLMSVVDKIRIHIPINKIVIDYKIIYDEQKMVVVFKNGKGVLFD